MKKHYERFLRCIYMYFGWLPSCKVCSSSYEGCTFCRLILSRKEREAVKDIATSFEMKKTFHGERLSEKGRDILNRLFPRN